MATIRLPDPLAIPTTSQLPDEQAIKRTGATMKMPFRIGLTRDNSDFWTLPIEPLVSVRGRNMIVRRNISKKNGIGSVKELWSQDDYSISVRGIFVSEKLGEFPEENLSKLKKLLEAKRSLVISCRLTDILGITLMAVEEWELPETSGLENQYFRISGYSDQDFELI
ncbi:DUF6046 domain-containing protein [Larkinella sp. VNQ87]|uniref:DUF6046 domain-containing protein n=1 Tax=Larkinella sp. VNQ87 TaxID=3400921 RepID=UPI003C0CEC00